MGKRGPRPTPTAKLKTRGSRQPGKRKGEPQPELGGPSRPEWLHKDAKAAWDELVPQLLATGVLAKIDGNALARYCAMWVRWKRANAHVEKYGASYQLKDDKGEFRCFQQFPEVAEVNKLSVLLLRLEQEFGLTPASRPGLSVEKPEFDPLTALLQKRQGLN